MNTRSADTGGIAADTRDRSAAQGEDRLRSVLVSGTVMMSGGHPVRDKHTEARHPQQLHQTLMDALLLAPRRSCENTPLSPAAAYYVFPVLDKILADSY